MSYLLPLGPFDRAWRGPQQIVLQANGEAILGARYRGGLHARGCAARLCRLPLAQCYPLVTRVCGVHSLHHELAWTMALEQLAGRPVPPRAQTMRILVAEMERIASHLYDGTHILRHLSPDGIWRRLPAIRELPLEAARIITGHRLVHDFVLPGGVQDDIHRDEYTELGSLLDSIAEELSNMLKSLLRNRGLRRRMQGIGVLQPQVLMELGIAGWIARASGIDQDLRRDRAYMSYQDLPLEIVIQPAGDVDARLMLLMLEAYAAADYSRTLLRALPTSLWRGDLLSSVPAGIAAASVEAPSGVLTYELTSDGERLTEVRIAGPPHPEPLLTEALADCNVDDAALVIASLGLCSACIEA